jgi:hypothetical protein
MVSTAAACPPGFAGKRGNDLNMEMQARRRPIANPMIIEDLLICSVE